MTPSVVIVNVDTAVSHRDMVDAAAALQQQVIEHFFPYWNLIASVRAAGNGTPASPNDPPRAGEWIMRLQRVPTMDDVLGFHSLDGLFVFPELDAVDDVPWTVTASHEILEALADPYLRRSTQDDRGRFWALEVCDAVEQDTYSIDGVEVSNFILPAWGEPTPHSDRYDYLGKCLAPWEIRPGGYGQTWNGTGWTSHGAQRHARVRRADLQLSRSARRSK